MLAGKKYISLSATLIVFFAICMATFCYYPKWKQAHTEAVISWDVAGYYLYLPALFIHQDVKKLSFLESAIDEYGFVPYADQALPVANGNRVIKYAMGQAVMYSPFFLISHLWASNSNYPPDGYSLPYQLGIEFEILFFAFIGLWFLRLILLRYFSDGVSTIVILCIGLATNYFEYSSMSGAMTHNNLFAIYALLIYQVIRFYEKPNYMTALAIGGLVGLAALTRPTEIIAVIPVLCWGISFPWSTGIRMRFQQIKDHFLKYTLMAGVAAFIGCWQLIYWKYVSGEWFVYSYGNEGFDWLHPHVVDCLISMKAGWFVYSPIMVFSIVGFYFLYRRYKSLFPSIAPFCFLAMYIVFSWQTWWYGGSLGQRALIQYYPFLAFPLAAFIVFILDNRVVRFIFAGVLILFTYYNAWLTHHIHRGGTVFVSQMTRPYFWKILGQNERNEDDLKLLDIDEHFSGEIHKQKTVYSNDFELDSPPKCHIPPLSGQHSYCLSDLHPQSPEFGVRLLPGQAKWVRATADFKCEYKIWSHWQMGFIKIRLYDENQIIKEKFYRVHRLLEGGKAKSLFIDIKCPKRSFDRVSVVVHKGGEGNILVFDNLRIEAIN